MPTLPFLLYQKFALLIVLIECKCEVYHTIFVCTHIISARSCFTDWRLFIIYQILIDCTTNVESHDDFFYKMYFHVLTAMWTHFCITYLLIDGLEDHQSHITNIIQLRKGLENFYVGRHTVQLLWMLPSKWKEE